MNALEILRIKELELRRSRRVLTLDPEKDAPTLISVLLAKSTASDTSKEEGAAAFSLWLDGIEAFFPGNLFWDFDLVVAECVSQAEASDDPRTFWHAWRERIVSLHALFSSKTTIRFQYVHDFLYGYDWAKWRNKDIESRRDIAPFSLEFLDVMRQRGQELLALIEADDIKYHQMKRAGFRNPFAFRRDPSAEVRLHREIVRRDMIPLRTWTSSRGTADDFDYSAMRVKVARLLELD